MKKKIEKVLFDLLSKTPFSKAVLGHEIAATFGSMVGGNINDYFDDLKIVLNELEENGFAHTEMLPNGNLRVTKGVDFSSWTP